MKKHIFSVILVLLAVSLFAQTEADYDKILKGDFSAVAGYYVNENNYRYFFRSDGSQVGLFGNNYRVRDFAKTKGVYTWFVNGFQDGFYVMLFPIGIEVEGIKTDTTKTRISINSRNSKEIFYKESEFPATHTASEDIVLKSSPQSSSETIGTIKKGTVVLWNKGWYDGWNRDKAEKEKWARVYTPDGLEGSCSPDNLKQIIEVVFPSTFLGTWKRDNYNNTITLTTNTYKSSSQDNYRSLVWVYGNLFTLTNSRNDGTINLTIKLVNGNLEISGDTGTTQDNWNGVWKKQ